MKVDVVWPAFSASAILHDHNCNYGSKFTYIVVVLLLVMVTLGLGNAGRGNAFYITGILLGIPHLPDVGVSFVADRN